MEIDHGRITGVTGVRTFKELVHDTLELRLLDPETDSHAHKPE